MSHASPYTAAPLSPVHTCSVGVTLAGIVAGVLCFHALVGGARVEALWRERYFVGRRMATFLRS